MAICFLGVVLGYLINLVPKTFAEQPRTGAWTVACDPEILALIACDPETLALTACVPETLVLTACGPETLVRTALTHLFWAWVRGLV